MAAAPLRPRLLHCLRSYTRSDLRADLTAGMTVGVIALSLSMALGIASGASPAVGIVTAIVAGLLTSLFGGSRVAIGGPTAAFIPVVLAVAHDYGPQQLVVCTLLAGVMLMALGLARMGTMIKYIPMPVVAGFTAGIAVYIFSTQVRDFLGLTLPPGETVPAEFLEKIGFFSRHAGDVHWPAVGLAAASVAVIKLWPHAWSRYVPPSLVAVVLGTLAAALLPLHVETIGSRFGVGAIPQSLPLPHLPVFDLGALQDLVRPAFTIALLGAVESLLCCVVADGMIEDRHDSNMELVAQGLANVGSALFLGLPATGAIARTAANIRSGARSPVAGIVHSLTILGVVLTAAPLARHIPLPVLSGILVVVALNMGEWRNFGRIRGWPKSDSFVFLLSFALTVLTDLALAVEVGVALSAFLFIRRVSASTRILSDDEREFDFAPEDSFRGKVVPPGVLLYHVYGAFLFSTADKLETALDLADRHPDVLVLGMKRVLAMDATGIHRLEELHARLRKRGRWLLLAGPHTQPLMAMTNAGFIDRVGPENFCGNVDTALARAKELLAGKAAHPASAAAVR